METTNVAASPSQGYPLLLVLAFFSNQLASNLVNEGERILLCQQILVNQKDCYARSIAIPAYTAMPIFLTSCETEMQVWKYMAESLRRSPQPNK